MGSAATAPRSAALHRPSPGTADRPPHAHSAPPAPHGCGRLRTVRSALRWEQTRERGVDCRARESMAQRWQTYRSPRSVARASGAHSSDWSDWRLLASACAGLLTLNALRQAVLDHAELLVGGL